MIVIKELDSIKNKIQDSVVALGNFDGVHKGHQLLIAKAVDIAKENNLKSVVFTFSDLPLNVIAGKTVVKNIQTVEEKITSIESLGVDFLVCIPFDEYIRFMSPKAFAKDIIKEKLLCKFAVCGFNYSFGNMGKGTAESLLEYGKELGFDVFVMPEYDIKDTLVSSSNVRNFLESGEVEKYEEFTGRKYSIQGNVIEGQKFGNRMGFPTANLSLDPNMALPCNGVYVTNIFVDDKMYHSVTNVGNKPTVGNFNKNAETHIFDFNKDIYDSRIKVEFISILRKEQKFDNIEDLCNQIKQDCIKACEIHKELEK